MTRNTPARKAESPIRRAVTAVKGPPTGAKAHSTGKRTPKPTTFSKPKRIAQASVAAGSQALVDPPRDSKQAQLVASLRPAAGVTIAQMMALTGWQAHTVRGAISGVLRKKLGLNVVLTKTDGTSRYRIEPAAAR